jgi:hypothetical protein
MKTSSNTSQEIEAKRRGRRKNKQDILYILQGILFLPVVSPFFLSRWQ